MDVLAKVVGFLAKRQVQSFLVGGSVRDRLLGRVETRDLDLAIVGDASRLARSFANAEGGAFYLMDAEHNVARVLFGKTYVDFAELRGDLQSDLASRDFTINAMAQPLTAAPGANATGLIDPFDGSADLSSKQVRAVSAAIFEHDPVRLLRAIRIAGELGFSVEPTTLALVRRAAPLLRNASLERARDELFKIIDLPQGRVQSALEQMDELGLVDALLPELAALKGVSQSAPHVYDVFVHSIRTLDEIVRLQVRDYAEVANGKFVPELRAHFETVVSAERTRGTLLRLAALIHDIGKAVTRTQGEDGAFHFIEHEDRGAGMAEALLRRLRFSNGEIEIVTRIIREHLRPPQLARAARVTDRAIYRFFRDAGDSGIDVCVLALADTRAKSAPAIDEEKDRHLRATLVAMLERYYEAPHVVVAPEPILDGRALMHELGLAPGPRIGELLEAIREAQAAGEVTSREEALALARTILSKGG